jgi:hypothetical protein
MLLRFTQQLVIPFLGKGIYLFVPQSRHTCPAIIVRVAFHGLPPVFISEHSVLLARMQEVGRAQAERKEIAFFIGRDIINREMNQEEICLD